jgi:hypothetical protein
LNNLIRSLNILNGVVKSTNRMYFKWGFCVSDSNGKHAVR